MGRILTFLRHYKKEAVLGPLFKMLEALFELFIPLVVADIVNVGIVNKDQTYIIQRCALMAGLGLVGLIASVTAQYFSAKAAVGMASELRLALFQKSTHNLCSHRSPASVFNKGNCALLKISLG